MERKPKMRSLEVVLGLSRGAALEAWKTIQLKGIAGRREASWVPDGQLPFCRHPKAYNLDANVSLLTSEFREPVDW